MIHRLKSILTEQTLEVKVKCVVDQSVIDKNFEIIKECLKDLQDKQFIYDKTLQELLQKNDRMQKNIEDIKTTTHISGPLSQQIIKVQRQQDRTILQSRQKSHHSTQKNQIISNIDNQPSININTLDQNALRQLIRKLQNQVNKQAQINKTNNLQNIKDINLLLKDVKQIKQKIDSFDDFKKQLEEKKNEEGVENNSESNLENIRILQNELHKQSQKMDKLQSEIDKLKNKNSNILEKLKGLEGKDGLGIGGDNNFDGQSPESKIQSLKGELEKLSQKVDTFEKDTRSDLKKVGTRFQNVDLSLKQLEDRVSITQAEIEEIKKILDGLNSNANIGNFDPNASKDKSKLQKDLKRLQQMMKKDSYKNDDWRRRIDQLVKQHTLNISDILGRLNQIDSILSSLPKNKDKFNMSMNNSDEGKSNRLPSIKKNLKLKSISHDESDIDKKLQQLKGEIQQWVRQLLDARNINGQDSSKRKDEFLDGIDIKLQEIKMILERKADQDGVKKSITYLDNKINQIWTIISQPDTQDALIARKGWNCLSCAKKLQKYRGRLGDHVNWNGLTTANYSPPRIGYSQSVSHNTTQNITIPVKNRMQEATNSKQYS